VVFTTLLVEMIKRGVDVLFEQHGARKCITDFGKGKALGKKDHDYHDIVSG
jgi:hypothetical protein